MLGDSRPALTLATYMSAWGCLRPRPVPRRGGGQRKEIRAGGAADLRRPSPAPPPPVPTSSAGGSEWTHDRMDRALNHRGRAVDD